ncbi:MAG: peptide deformylase [Planctomycetota bacterium]|nr:peptide deformylase [Planctomycetota bacterium]MDA1142182.1 peptide deformylase [Planctomycetota bacterium]
MPVRNVVLYPDERLRKKCRRVKEVNDEVLRLIEDMVETMYAERGVGLAAPQIGVNRRVIVVHAHQAEDDPRSRLLGIVNPEIVERGQSSEFDEEGCLSIPGIRGDVLRHTEIVIEALDHEGDEIRLKLNEFEARVFQHEMDHLDGILFTDHLDGLTREVLLRQYEVQQAEEKGK